MATFAEALSEDYDSAETLDADLGTGESEVEGEPTVSEASFFDADQYKDQVVRIKVDGEDVEVPLAEALQGYSRTADYTRKTQELAAQRAELQYAETLAQALKANPEQTLQLLQNQYGFGKAAPAQADGDDDAWLDDPSAVAQRQYEDRISRIEDQFARADLDRTIGGLQTRYGNDFDPKAVVAQALQQNTTDLEGVYKQMAFDRIVARHQAATERATTTAGVEAAATAAKAAIDGLVSTGGSAAGAGGLAVAPTTISGAVEAAMAEVGWAWSDQ